MIQKLDTAEGLVTYDEFRVFVADGQKADLIDGVVYMASPDSGSSNDLNVFLTTLMQIYIETKKVGGKVRSNRFACKINDLRAPEPDVLYVVAARMQLLEENHLVGGPDIAVEIVARESRNRDYSEKRMLYEEADVGEYWIIDPLQRRCEFLRLEQGRYESVPLEQNRIFRSTVLPGFWLDVNWLLARNLPFAIDCLREILASPNP